MKDIQTITLLAISFYSMFVLTSIYHLALYDRTNENTRSTEHHTRDIQLCLLGFLLCMGSAASLASKSDPSEHLEILLIPAPFILSWIIAFVEEHLFRTPGRGMLPTCWFTLIGCYIALIASGIHS